MSGNSEPGLAASSVADLWALARALSAIAVREASPSELRRAVVVAAIAGSGGRAQEYDALSSELHAAAVHLVLDPEPLFNAAAALVSPDDGDARGSLVRRAHDGARVRLSEAELAKSLYSR